MLQKNNNFHKLIILIIIVLLGIYTLFFIANLPITVHAEDEPIVYDNTLPFYFSSIDNYNSMLYDDIFEAIDNANLPVYDSDYVLYITDFGFQGRTEGQYYWYNIYFNLVPIIDFSNASENFNWYTTTLNYNLDPNKPKYNFYVQYEYYHSFTPQVYNVSDNVPTQSIFGYTPTYLQNDGVYFCNRVPAYFSKNFYDGSGNIVLHFVDEVPPTPLPTGHATEPINDPDNFIKDGQGHIIGHKPTQPTPTTYTPPTYTPPTLDNSSTEALLESIWDMLSYGFVYVVTVIVGAIQNLASNIWDFIKFIVESIEYGFNKIIKSIQDFATDFYNNMVSLFEPTLNDITDGIHFFTEPWSQEQFETRLSESEFYTSITTIQTNTTSFYNAMSSIEEPDHFTLHYSTGFHPDIEVGGNVIPTIEGEISFDWLYPLRNIYRPILWVICVYQMFEYGCSSLSGALLGHNSRR